MNVVPVTHRAKQLAIHVGVDAARHVALMLERQNPHGRPTGIREFPGGAIGCVGCSGLSMHGNVCFFTGEPINGPNIGNMADADAAVRLFAQYDGAFTGVFFDAARGVLVIATDCLGMQPLYLRRADGELTLVTETRALRGEPDLAAWGAFISIGHPIGERSLLRDLSRVPPASVLTFDIAQRRLAIQRYWDWPAASNAWQGFDFLHALERDIEGYAAFGHAGTVLLSGGFDSRLLLFLLNRAGVSVDALIVAHADEHGDADGRLAEAVARLAGVRFRRASPAKEFFSSPAYVDYLCASDAGFPSLDLFISKVAAQIDGAAVWDGLAPGFVFMPLHQPEGGFAAYLHQEVRGADSAIWRAARTVFNAEAAEAMYAGFRDDLQRVVANLPQDMHGLARFVIENRSRNRAAMNPLKVYADRVDAFTPGLSRDFLAHAVTLPFREKQYGRFYRNLLLRLDPRTLSVPFVSGGELMQGGSAGPGYWRECARAGYRSLRARYPSVFSRGQRAAPEYSTFLNGGLFEDDDRWLAPRLHDKLKAVTPENYTAWKLLFHWKAWQWVHEGRLQRMLGPSSSP
jgi:hypothetical protein